MRFHIPTSRRFRLLFFGFFGLAAGLLPMTARAATIAEGLQSALGNILFWIASALATLLTFIAQFVVWAFNLNATVLTSPAVATGWIISRDLANLGFVLVVILIAFATVIQYERYGLKALFIRLVIAALLINFSLTIAGVFIDFAGVLTDFFIHSAIPGNAKDLGEALASAFQPHALLQVKSEAGLEAIFDGTGQAAGVGTAFLTSLLFIILFTAIAAISFLTLGIMFLIRFVALGILLILAPLAWLFYAFPPLNHLYSQWWSTFLRWVFFAPAAAFFIYLAMFTTLTRNAYNQAQLSKVAGTTTFNAQLFVENFSQTAFDMILLSALLLGGLTVANGMGIKVGSEGLKLAKTVARGGTLGLAGRGGSYAGRFVRTLGKSDKQDSYAQKAVSYLSKVPVLNRATGGLSAALTRAGEQDQARVEALQKERYDKMSDDTLMNLAQTPGWNVMSDIDRAAALGAIAKKGKISEFQKANSEAFEKLRASAQKVGTVKPLTAVRPDLAVPKASITIKENGQDVTRAETQYEAVSRAIGKNKKIEEVEAEAFKSAEVVLSLSPQHIERLAREGDGEQRENVINTLREIEKSGSSQYVPADKAADVERQLKQVRKATIESPAWQKYVTAKEEEEMKAQRAREKAEEDIAKEAEKERIRKAGENA